MGSQFSTATISIAGNLTLGVQSGLIWGVVGIICLSFGGLYVYTRKYHTMQNIVVIQQHESEFPLSSQQLHPSYNGPKIPKWSKITMSQQEFDSILIMTEQRYQQQVRTFTCPFTNYVMRNPGRMICCQNRAEKVILEFEIEQNRICKLCKAPANEYCIVLDEDMYEKILGFRQRLLKTFKCLPDSQKGYWKELIDKQFGKGYTSEHLENWETE